MRSQCDQSARLLVFQEICGLWLRSPPFVIAPRRHADGLPCLRMPENGAGGPNGCSRTVHKPLVIDGPCFSRGFRRIGCACPYPAASRFALETTGPELVDPIERHPRQRLARHRDRANAHHDETITPSD